MRQSPVKELRTDIPLPRPYHGLHVAPAQAGYEEIRWLRPTSRSDRVRVRRHTCECRPTVYELCAAGGLMFVRRTVEARRGVRIHETDRINTAGMRELWRRLILGQAR